MSSYRVGRDRHRRLIPRLRALLPALAAAVLATTTLVAGPLAPAAEAATNTSQFKGVNWADPRDNFVNGPVIPSGLSTSDSYATTYAKATAIVSGFKTNLGANTVRFGMNDKTVSSTWWNSYIGALDATLAQGMNVMIAPWAYPGACSCVKDTAAFYKMWDTVINRYLSKPGVYFEIYNEPGGYSNSAWDNFAASFVAHYPQVPRGRIVVAGSGTDTNLATVGADSRLSGTLLSLHLYSVFGISHTTEAAWVTELNNHLHGYGSRTIITEFGVPMSTGVNSNGARDGNNNRSYYWAMTDTMHSKGIGSIYWPGLRTGDSWSMEQLHGTGTNLSLTTVNASGRDRLEYAWGL
ncbi:MAG: cellulase family glycosylhydrolase [Catenulispora sp.]|nr:cellulase family glycosylhydrolase [Catenulispora sp.]